MLECRISFICAKACSPVMGSKLHYRHNHGFGFGWRNIIVLSTENADRSSQLFDYLFFISSKYAVVCSIFIACNIRLA